MGTDIESRLARELPAYARRGVDALEAADGSQTAFVLKRKAGRNTGNTIMQFVLGAIIAVTLIVLLGIIVPESRLPGVML